MRRLEADLGGVLDRRLSRAEAGLGVMSTIQECLQSVPWNGTLALAPLEQVLPPGLVTVPVDDRPRSRLVLDGAAARPRRSSARSSPRPRTSSGGVTPRTRRRDRSILVVLVQP